MLTSELAKQVSRGGVHVPKSKEVYLWSSSKRVVNFPGSLFKEVAKTTSGTLVYRFERQIARKKFFLRTTLCPRFRNLQIPTFCILMSYFMESKLKKISIDSW